jgi:hypothetical protein
MNVEKTRTEFLTPRQYRRGNLESLSFFADVLAVLGVLGVLGVSYVFRVSRPPCKRTASHPVDIAIWVFCGAIDVWN